jgi:hypothetical protein
MFMKSGERWHCINARFSQPCFLQIPPGSAYTSGFSRGLRYAPPGHPSSFERACLEVTGSSRRTGGTFGSLAGFVVVTFLCCRLYILDDAFANPLNTGAAAVISAAVHYRAGGDITFLPDRAAEKIPDGKS